MDTDERYGAAVFRALDGEPGPSTVDVWRAVADGERHHRRVRLAGSAGVAAAVVAILATGWLVTGDWRHARTPQIAASAGASPSPSKNTVQAPACQIAQLPTPKGQPPKGVVTGADPSGRYILGRSYPNKPAAVIWTDGQPTAVAIPGEDGAFEDINTHGVAVGNSLMSGKSAAWVYTGGAVIRLKGRDAQVTGINDQGVMVGATADGPVQWRSPGDEPTRLPLPGAGWEVAAWGIDEDGTIVGTAVRAGRTDNAAVIWRPDGTLQTLPAPHGHDTVSKDYRGSAIRGGLVLGRAFYDWPGGKYIDGVVWNLATGAVTSTPGSFTLVNPHGWIAGTSGVVADGAKLDLPRLGTEDPRQTIVAALSDDGTTIAGQVAVEPLPVVWKCKQH